MLKQTGRILVIILALYGLVQLTSLAFPGLKNILNDPAVVNTPMVKGAIDYANQVLPESQQIVIPEYSPDPNEDKTITGTITNTVTEKVTEKISEVATEAVDSVKDEASDQVCKALTQKLQSECN
jgi:hypothetical protein